eukprot:CAMPEP_0184978062 /NCGR_PEP_ID=MMETSP1098-20130426/8678_1 /TAXON_ID=89044 /ORGANISM="Spumella elongata, Strain CCAP 955/1" /LENGTH=148 /DNA_ID=CAMNT_0027501161 /DNA_START=67 /DNA_END=513 /DNA_ORIENTATION=+
MRSFTTAELLRPSTRTRHKIPQKRASNLMTILKEEGLQALKAGREWPDFSAGDAIEIHKLPYMSATVPDVIKGVVIGRFNKHMRMDASLLLLNVESGTKVERRIPIYSPLIKDIKVIQKAFIHKGKKRVRRSKLYYLSDLHPKFYTVK